VSAKSGQNPINRDGQEVAAVRGVLGSMLALLEEGATL